MRVLTFDHFEFEHVDSEERLEISIAMSSDFPFPNLDSFTKGTSPAGVSSIAATVLLCDHPMFEQIREYLLRFAGVEVPEKCDWAARILNDEWNDLDLVCESKG